MLCETLSYYLYTTVNSIEEKNNSIKANSDIFNSVLRPMMLMTVRKYLEGKTCYIPTASDFQSKYIYNLFLKGFSTDGRCISDISLISDSYRGVEESNQIVIGRFDECKEIVRKIDWSFIYPIMSTCDIRSIYYISDACCFPIPCNNIPWHSDYMNWILNEFYVRADNDYFQVTSEY